MSDFISSETKKIHIETADPRSSAKWVEIKSELPYKDMFAIANIQNDPEKITDVLEKCIVNWNFEDEKGDVQVTRENIEKLKINYITTILEGITSTMNDNTEVVKKK